MKPVTTDDFLIGSWVTYFSGDNAASMREQTKRLADAGINFLPMGGWIPDRGEPVSRDLSSIEWWQHVDEVMRDNGILYFFSSGASEPYGGPAIPGAVSDLSAEGIANAQRIVPSLENCAGYHLRDEPGIDDLRELGAWAKEYAALQKGKYAFVNMLPGYGGYDGEQRYTAYLEEWIKRAGKTNIEYLSHDYYCFAADGTSFGIFGEMEIMRKLGLKYGIKTHAFPQACGWEGMRIPNADEMRWNVYAYIAYGFKGVTYFNFSDVLADASNDEGAAKLQAVTQTNRDVRATSDIIMNLDCMHAYHTRPLAGTETLPADFVLQPETGSDLVISDMQARDGTEPYFMIFNRKFDQKVDVTFTLSDGSGIAALDVWDPSTKTFVALDIADNTFDISLIEGEGKFIRITKI